MAKTDKVGTRCLFMSQGRCMAVKHRGTSETVGKHRSSYDVKKGEGVFVLTIFV